MLYQRCRSAPKPEYDSVTGLASEWPFAEDEQDSLCSKDGQGLHQCSKGITCAAPQDEGQGREIDKIENQELISYGIIHFDNLLVAIMTIFQMITLEGWTLVMYNLQDATQAWIAVIFCILIVIVGSFFLLNVILAVITDSLERADEDMT